MRKIFLRNVGLYAVVDNAFEYLRESQWYRSQKGYAVRSEKGKTIYMHKVIYPGAGFVDHKDQNKLNNRCINLRRATNAQNGANGKLRSDNTSGHRGIYFNRSLGKYVAQICVGNKNQHLGCFATLKEAVAEYNAFAKKYFGDFAVLNKI